MPNDIANKSADPALKTVLDRVCQDYKENWPTAEQPSLFLSLSDIKELLDDSYFHALLIESLDFTFYSKILMKNSFLYLNIENTALALENLRELFEYYLDHGVSETRAILVSVLLSRPFKDKYWLSKDDLAAIFTGKVECDAECQGLAYALWEKK